MGFAIEDLGQSSPEKPVEKRCGSFIFSSPPKVSARRRRIYFNYFKPKKLRTYAPQQNMS